MTVGRPSDFTDDLAELICIRLADGESLRKICAEADMPDRNTVFRWLNKNADFAAKYARAREIQADHMDDLVLETAEGCTSETAQAARVKIDAYKWRAAKLRPKVYGDKQTLDVTVAKRAEDMTDDELAAIASGGRRPLTEAQGDQD